MLLWTSVVDEGGMGGAVGVQEKQATRRGGPSLGVEGIEAVPGSTPNTSRIPKQQKLITCTFIYG